MTVRRLVLADAAAYRALMLEGYDRHPDAFTSSAGERAALPLSWWESRLASSARAKEVVFGAFENDRLVGSAGLSFESREKARHKATFFGMYVAPEARRCGFGEHLLLAALAHAASSEGVKLVQLTVTQGNDGAQSLYERCGFVAYGVEPFAVAVGATFVSKIHMWRAVAALE